MADRTTSKPSIMILARHYATEQELANGKTPHYARLNRDLALDLAADGWIVRVITVGHGAEPTREKDGTVDVVRVPTRTRKDYMGFLRTWFALYNMARSLPRHDVIVTVGDTPFLNMAGARLSDQKQSSHIHWCHEIIPELWPMQGHKLPEALMNWLDRKSTDALKSADAIVVAGQCMKDHLIYRGIESDRVHIIYPWANADPGGAVVDESMTEPPQLRYVDQTMLFRVMYAGTISGATPVSPLLDTAISIIKDVPDIEFVFVGEGAAFDKIAALKARHGFDRIKLLPTPPQNHMATMMGSADVHVVSLKPEATGLTVPMSFFTSIASHRPVVCITSDKGEIARVVSTFPFGEIVDPQDTTRIRDIILNYRHDRHEWFNAHQASIMAHAKFNHETARQEWLRVIKSSFRPVA